MWKRPSSSPDVGFEAFLCFYFKIKLSEKHISNLLYFLSIYVKLNLLVKQ